MSIMLRLELVGLVLLACTQILTEQRDYYGPRNQYAGHHRSRDAGGSHHGARTREIQIKYGRLRGTVVQPKADYLQLVDVFLGVPYAEPPVGPHRFEPPTTQTPWSGVRHFVEFKPVCPQVLPNMEEEVDATRHEYLKRLLPFLQNQSEDCLYLNIYAPHQNNSHRGNLEKFPVIVFIHGESYEWNSGNPYDGSVLAAYGNVVFVTVNFRLGILGFLRPGTKDDTASNFGLLDQIAALVWLRDNIGRFGGDPNGITLLGHGTGAVFVNLLMLSPIDGLFKRAILMSGSALNPDAIGKAPLQITKQVAHALNCPQVNDEELVACLKNRSVQDLLSVKIHKPKYVPAFAPLVESAVIPDKPANLMKNAERLARFDLMYGVTELEKFHVLPGVALLEGLSDSRRDEFIRDSVKASHELEPDLILRKVLEHYRDERQDQQPDMGTEYEWNRDIALEVASDSCIVAPLVATANLHSRANPKSYMYVFSHLRSFREQAMQDLDIRRTLHGEELPYVLGVPLDGEGYHLSAPYDRGEMLLSKAMMDWWCNFAYSGNPNNVRPPPRRLSYLRDEYKASSPYHIDWPEYDPENQTYFNLTTPPQIGRSYRAAEMEFWNDAIPQLLRRPKAEKTSTTRRPYGDFPDNDGNGDGDNSSPANVVVNSTGMNHLGSASNPGNLGEAGEKGNKSSLDPDRSSSSSSSSSGSDENSGRGGTASGTRNSNGNSSSSSSSSAVSLVIGFGVIFLLINATALVCLYRKRQRMRKKASGFGNPLAQSSTRRSDRTAKQQLQPISTNNPTIIGSLGELGGPVSSSSSSKRPKLSQQHQHQQERELGYCSSASKPDLREIIKNDKAYDNNSNFGRRSRDNSTSTIDTKIKVREWIQQEIVHRCSPRFLRKTRETLQREHRDKLMRQQQRRQEDEEQLRQLDEALYDAAGAQEIRVRPGVRSHKRQHHQQQQQQQHNKQQTSKVSVAIDATPAARTDSVLNQVPIELAKASSEYLNCLEDAATVLGVSEYCEPAELREEEARAEEAKREHEEEERAGKGEANVVVIEHHHSRSDPLPMDKIPSYGDASKAISASTRVNESDSGSASSLYAKINPRTKSRLPVHQKHVHIQDQIQESHLQPQPQHQQLPPTVVASGGSSTLPRLLTFGSPLPPPPLPPHQHQQQSSLDVNVTSREAHSDGIGSNAAAHASGVNSHEEALRTIRRRNYPKVLPDIEKRRSLPPNASFVVGPSSVSSLTMSRPQGYFTGHRQLATPPSPPPRLYGTSRSLDCVEDCREEDEEAEKESANTSLMSVTTNLHVGPLRKKNDSPKNQSSPNLVEAASESKPKLSSATSLPVCPIHGTPREPASMTGGTKSEPRIVITPIVQSKKKPGVEDCSVSNVLEGNRGVDQPDCPTRPRVPERATKLPRIIIKPTPVTGTLQRHHGQRPYNQAARLREKMPLPGETGSNNSNNNNNNNASRIPSAPGRQRRMEERAEIVQRVNVPDAAVTKL